MTPETIGVIVTFKEPITFHLRIISLAEETALRQKMFGATEDEKAEKAYQNNVDMLADLSAAMPTARRLVTTTEQRAGDKAEREYSEMQEVNLTEAKTFPSEVVRDFFSDKTVLKERLAEYAVRGYFVKLMPDVSFS